MRRGAPCVGRPVSFGSLTVHPSAWLGKTLARRALLSVLVTAASLAFAGAASAVPFTSSAISTPADGTFPIYNYDAPNTLHVDGTTSGGDVNNLADIVCFFGTS